MAKSLVSWVIRVRWQSTLVNKMALPSRYWRIWRHIHALIGRNTIALGVQRFAAGANIICLTYATDWWAVNGPVIHGESKSQATGDGAARTMCRCGSTSLASCQHVGWLCVCVCSWFVCNWRARFKQNIIVLCICRHDMVAIMMSNPGLSNKFDVDPLSNSDSKMSNSLFSRGRLITLPRSACLDLRGECFKCRSKIPAHPLRLWMEVTHFGGHGWYSSFRIPNVNN